MDPEAALNKADQAVSDLDVESAAEHLEYYWQWRSAGGFEPYMRYAALRGDVFAGQIASRLRLAAAVA